MVDGKLRTARADRLLPLLKRAYASMLRLYPRDYLEVFDAEMVTVFEAAAEERLRLGPANLIPFFIAEMIGIVLGAVGEWIAKLLYGVCHTNSYISGRCTRDLGLMRPTGVDRDSFYRPHIKTVSPSDIIDDQGLCLNMRQKLILASPIRRVLMLTCEHFLPAHPPPARRSGN